MLRKTWPTSGRGVSGQYQQPLQITSTHPAPRKGGPLDPVFWVGQPHESPMWLAELLLALSGDIETNPGPTFCKTCHNPFFFLGNHIHLPRKIRKLLNPHPTCPNPPTPIQKRSSTTPHRNAKQNNSQLPIPHIRDLFFSRVNTNCTEHKYHSLPSSLHIEIIFKMAARLETLGDKNIACIFCRYTKYKHNPSPLSPVTPLPTPLRPSPHNQTHLLNPPHNSPTLSPVTPLLTPIRPLTHNQTHHQDLSHNPPPLSAITPPLTPFRLPSHNQTSSQHTSQSNTTHPATTQPNYTTSYTTQILTPQSDLR